MLACLTGLVACVAQAPVVIASRVQPQTVLVPATGTGELTVYTAWQVSGYDLSTYPAFSGYWLSGPDGAVEHWIENRAGAFAQAPQVVRLPPGEYRVRGLAEGAGEVIVPVAVGAGERTAIDLARLSSGARR